MAQRLKGVMERWGTSRLPSLEGLGVGHLMQQTKLKGLLRSANWLGS